MSKKAVFFLVVSVIATLAIAVVFIASKRDSESAREAWEALKARLPKREKSLVSENAAV